MCGQPMDRTAACRTAPMRRSSGCLPLHASLLGTRSAGRPRPPKTQQQHPHRAGMIHWQLAMRDALCPRCIRQQHAVQVRAAASIAPPACSASESACSHAPLVPPCGPASHATSRHRKQAQKRQQQQQQEQALHQQSMARYVTTSSAGAAGSGGGGSGASALPSASGGGAASAAHQGGAGAVGLRGPSMAAWAAMPAAPPWQQQGQVAAGQGGGWSESSCGWQLDPGAAAAGQLPEEDDIEVGAVSRRGCCAGGACRCSDRRASLTCPVPLGVQQAQ